MPTKVQSMEEIFKVPRIIDGHLVVDERDVYAVFEIKSKLNPLTADSRDLDSALQRLTSALDGLRRVRGSKSWSTAGVTIRVRIFGA